MNGINLVVYIISNKPSATIE
ncbi:hypothetical protein J5754_05040 [bacterium]|nr:hypothetical protein [bacterium]